MKQEIGLVGLGKMGGGIAAHLAEQGYRVVAYNRTAEKARGFAEEYGGEAAETIDGLVAELPAPRTLWLMLPAGKATEEMLLGADGLITKLEKCDTVIESANSFYEDTMRRARIFEAEGIRFIDVGYSGGPSGARNGGCLMIGGQKEIVDEYMPLFAVLAVPNGLLYCGPSGAGHFVKMVHNGIEYGMMQSLAEGFAVLKSAPFTLNLKDVAHLYNNGSVITSRLVGWAENAFKDHGNDLADITSTVAHTGEGEWTVKTAEKLGVVTASIKLAFDFRVASKDKPSYTGQVLSALRNQFGGHAAKK